MSSIKIVRYQAGQVKRDSFGSEGNYCRPCGES